MAERRRWVDEQEWQERRGQMAVRYGGWAAGLAAGLVLVGVAVASGMSAPAVSLGTAVVGLTGAILVIAAVEFGIFYIVPRSLRDERAVAMEGDKRIERQTRAAVDDARLKMNNNMARFEAEMDERLEGVDTDLRQRLEANEAMAVARFEELEERMQGDLEEVRGIVHSEVRAGALRVDEGIGSAREESRTVREEVALVRRSVQGVQSDVDDLREEILRREEETERRERILAQRLRILEEAVARESEEIESLHALAPGGTEPGDVPVAQIEGIRADQVLRLGSLGIHTASQLRRANAQEVARELRTWPNQVRHWQALAELMRVEGVDPDAAEALDAAGIHDVHGLGEADPDALAERMAALKDADVPAVHQPVDPDRIRTWVEQARRLEERRG